MISAELREKVNAGLPEGVELPDPDTPRERLWFAAPGGWLYAFMRLGFAEPGQYEVVPPDDGHFWHLEEIRQLGRDLVAVWRRRNQPSGPSTE